MPGDATYPALTPTGPTNYTKVVRSDLSAQGVDQSVSTPLREDRGLGGAPLRCPPATTPKLLVAASANVPDDPQTLSVDAGVSVTPTVTLTPRYRLLDVL